MLRSSPRWPGEEAGGRAHAAKQQALVPSDSERADLLQSRACGDPKTARSRKQAAAPTRAAKERAARVLR